MRRILLTPHPLGLREGVRFVPVVPPQSSSDFSSLPGPPGCRVDSLLNEAHSPSVVWASWQPQLPGGLALGKAVKKFPHPWPPPLKYTPGDPLPHGQPCPTHFTLMRSRPHTRAALTGLTYLIKTAASKNGGSAPKALALSTETDSGRLRPAWTLAFLHQPLTFLSPSLLPSPPFSNICVQKGRKTLFGLASFHLSFFSPFKRLV